MTPHPIKIFYHIFAHSHAWRAMVPDQMNKLLYSGLLEKCAVCHITILGPQANECAEYVQSFPKVEILLDPQNQTAERVTLLRMHDLVEEDDYVLYIHSKGVTRTEHTLWIRVNDWRNMMEWFVIHHHNECIARLANHDAVGVNLMTHPAPHFSGNFWWVTGSHFRKLPRRIGLAYLDPEQYLLSIPCTVCCLYESKVDHYKNRWMVTTYVGSTPSSQG